MSGIDTTKDAVLASDPVGDEVPEQLAPDPEMRDQDPIDPEGQDEAPPVAVTDRKLVRAKLIAGLLAITALILASAVYVNQSVVVTINGVPFTAKRSELVVDLVNQSAASQLVAGNLVDVEGDLLEPSGGEDARIIVDGREAGPRDTVGNHRTIFILAGEDTVEETEVELAWKHFSLKRDGKGPIPVVIEPGFAAPTEVTRGVESGKEISRRDTGQSREPVVRYTSSPAKAGKLVALTFDDGPSNRETPRILRILKREKVKATFFVLGENVEKYPGFVARAASEGHQIAVHSYSHPYFTKSTPDEIHSEIDRCADLIEAETGERPTWIRPPYGLVDGLVFNELATTGYRVALWSVDPRDYARPGMQAVINRVVFNAHPGMVVLLHDGGGNRDDTVSALPGIIGELRDAGYRFVTMEEYALATGL